MAGIGPPLAANASLVPASVPANSTIATTAARRRSRPHLKRSLTTVISPDSAFGLYSVSMRTTPLLNPRSPGVHAGSRRTRNADDLDLRIHLPRICLRRFDVKWHIRQQIDLRQDQQRRLVKDGRILQ